MTDGGSGSPREGEERDEDSGARVVTDPEASRTGDPGTALDAADAAPAAPEAPAAKWYRRPRTFFLGVIGIYLLARLFSAIVLVLVGLHQVDVVWFERETGYLRMTVLWDAFWYRQIVEDGYPAVLPHDPDTGKLWQNPWAFYPMFPMMTRFVMNITGAGFALVGSTISLLFGGVAAVLMAILLRDKVGPKVALAGVAIWATCITAPTLQVAYTESLAMTMVCGVLLAFTKQRWWIASGIALLTGLTRPIAMPLGLVALVCVYLRWRQRRERPIPRSEYLAMLVSLAACGISGFIWLIVVWQATGVFSAYTDTMTAWRAYDGIQPFVPWWVSAMNVAHTIPGAIALLALIVGFVVAMVAGPWARGLGPQLRTWCLAYPAYLFATLDPTTSIFRYVILLFPWTVVMVGGGWGRPGEDPTERRDVERSGGAYAAFTRRAARALTDRRLWALTAGWVVFGLITQSWWIWEIWQFTPPSDDPP